MPLMDNLSILERSKVRAGKWENVICNMGPRWHIESKFNLKLGDQRYATQGEGFSSA